VPSQQAPAAPSQQEKMTASARDAARHGRCDLAQATGTLVRQLDARYYRDVFATDAEIAACKQRDGAVTQPSAEPHRKSSSTAEWLSTGITLGGLGLMVLAPKIAEASESVGWGTLAVGGLAFLVGPTTGHIYAGNTWNTGLKLRIATATLVGAGVAYAFNSDGWGREEAGLVGAALLVLTIPYLAATAYEVSTAKKSARNYNARYQSQVGIAPIVGRDMGLAFVGRF